MTKSRNRLGLRNFPMKRLRVGDSCLVGPFNSPNMGASMISRFRKKNAFAGSWEITQQQILLVNPKTCETFKMYLLTRAK